MTRCRALVVGLLGCTAHPADTPADGPPACPTWSEAEQQGTISDAAITEASGVVASRRHPDTLWVHNDSGDGARLFAVGIDGDTRGVVSLTGVEARDWEDLATASGADGESTLFVGDIGDNRGVRDEITVWHLPEPNTLSGTAAAPTQLPAERVTLTYPDGPHDAESLLVEPDGSLVVVTKSMSGASLAFRAAAPLGNAATLTEIARLDVGAPPMDGDKLVTAGDLSPDGRFVLLRTYLRSWVWTRAPGESLADAFGRPPCPTPVPAEPQGEAVGFAADGSGYWSISEGEAQPVWRVGRTDF